MRVVIHPFLLCALVPAAAWQPAPPSRRQWLASIAAASVGAAGTTQASAAPPISIIAEELGYFPVTNEKGQTLYVPKRIKRDSSEQAIALAQHLAKTKTRMYEAYWCPHCARQRELFGKQAWALIDHVECAPKGYGAQPKLCSKIDGYPTWKIKGKEVGGERPLSDLAKESGFPGVFDEALEENVPPPLGSGTCQLPKR